jgi:cytochrome c
MEDGRSLARAPTPTLILTLTLTVTFTLAGGGPAGRPADAADIRSGSGAASGAAAAVGPGASGAAAAGASRAAEPAVGALDVPQKTAEAFRGVEAKSSAQYLAEPRYANADLHRGELLAYACKACHALEPGEKNDLGPSLHGVIGRHAASLENFEYSDALKGSGLVWTPEAIETWLEEPAAFVPGTKMKFTGYQSARDRRDVVAYLLRHADGGDAGPSGP